jgi:hypothetical protein
MKKTSILTRSIKTTLLLIALVLPLYTLAQPGADEDVVDVPIDGGISLMIVTGVGYGLKKLHRIGQQHKNVL